MRKLLWIPTAIFLFFGPLQAETGKFDYLLDKWVLSPDEFMRDIFSDPEGWQTINRWQQIWDSLLVKQWQWKNLSNAHKQLLREEFQTQLENVPSTTQANLDSMQEVAKSIKTSAIKARADSLINSYISKEAKEYLASAESLIVANIWDKKLNRLCWDSLTWRERVIVIIAHNR